MEDKDLKNTDENHNTTDEKQSTTVNLQKTSPNKNSTNFKIDTPIRKISVAVIAVGMLIAIASILSGYQVYTFVSLPCLVVGFAALWYGNEDYSISNTVGMFIYFICIIMASNDASAKYEGIITILSIVSMGIILWSYLLHRTRYIDLYIVELIVGLVIIGTSIYVDCNAGNNLDKTANEITTALTSIYTNTDIKQTADSTSTLSDELKQDLFIEYETDKEVNTTLLPKQVSVEVLKSEAYSTEFQSLQNNDDTANTEDIDDANGTEQEEPTLYRAVVTLSLTKPLTEVAESDTVKLEYIFKDENSDSIVESYEQHILQGADKLEIAPTGQFNGYKTGSIKQSQVNKQLLNLLTTIQEENNTPDVPLYFIYGTMLVEGGITNANQLYENPMTDIYKTLMLPYGGDKQYENGDVYTGSIAGDSKVMIGPFQISSAYYTDWVSKASDKLIKQAGGTIPTNITNRGDTGQPLYLPDVVCGKLKQCEAAYNEANSYMSEHYKDWKEQPKEVKEFFGVMWYNVKYHGGASGIDWAKQHNSILSYFYDIAKEVYRDNTFLNDITNWSQASSKDNECVRQLCYKVDEQGLKNYLSEYKNYADEGNDTYLGDWVYAPKCLHFGLKMYEATLHGRV